MFMLHLKKKVVADEFACQGSIHSRTTLYPAKVTGKAYR
jgi:hypothetical protein